MIDFSKYTREAIQKEMLSQVDTHIDTREGSLVQTAIGPVAWYLEGIYMLLKIFRIMRIRPRLLETR